MASQIFVRQAAVILVLTVAGATPAAAASLHITQTGNVYSVFLEGGSDNGQFDTIEFSAKPDAGQFINLDSGLDGTRVRDPGEPLTFVNQRLGLPPVFGGLGYSVLGEVVSADRVSFTAGPLGGVIDTSGQLDGRLFLANLRAPQCAYSGVVTLYYAGSSIGSYDFTSGLDLYCPEPASGWLAAIAALACFGVRQRRGRSRLQAISQENKSC